MDDRTLQIIMRTIFDYHRQLNNPLWRAKFARMASLEKRRDALIARLKAAGLTVKLIKGTYIEEYRRYACNGLDGSSNLFPSLSYQESYTEEWM